MTTRSLTVPPARHCPTAQPAGAMVALPSQPRDALTPAVLAAIESARHEAWCRRASAERARLLSLPSTPAVVESIVVLEGLMAADAEAWEARVRTGRTA